MVGPNPSVPSRGYAPPGGRPGPGNPYAVPVRHVPPRRTVSSGIIGALGTLAAIVVIAVVALSAFGTHGGVGGTASGGVAHRASRSAATASPLYKTGELTPVDCRLPRIAPGSAPSMKTFMDTLTGCLDAVWGRQFRVAHLTFARPDRVFWAEPGRSPCGSYPQPGAAAFYCGVNNTMYVGLQNIVETSGDEPVSHYAVYARVIAHEYGHHVQQEAGILAYGHQLMNRQDVAARNEASRRIELQAQCFAGVFLGAERATLPMTEEQYRAMVDDVLGRGDDQQPPERRDHGSARHYAGWVIIGFAKRLLSACDTWTAASHEVS
jgi:predicted metalloprotease